MNTTMTTLLWLSLVTAASAYNLNSTASYQSTLTSGGAVVLCNTTFDSSNASGIVIQTPAFNQSARYGLAYALAENNQVTSPGHGEQASLLFSPLEQNFFDESSLGYAACLMAFNVPSMTLNTILRGQSDNGSCLQTFDSGCVEAIQRVANNATSLLGTPSQVAASLPNLCDSISGHISGNVPDECKVFLDPDAGYSLIGGNAPLTQSLGGSGSILGQSCQVSSGDDKSFYNLITEVGAVSNVTYDLVANAVWPLLAVFMPPANSRVNYGLHQPYAQMTCLRIDHYTNGSRVAPTLGTPTPISTMTNSNTAAPVPTTSPSNGLGANAFAGIATAIVVVVALIAAGAFVILRRRKRTRHNQFVVSDEKNQDNSRYHEISGVAVSELSSASELKRELPTSFTWELQGNQRHRSELDGNKGGQGHVHVYELATTK